ncbi:fasciclin-2-like [Epargyreus clarus]|uniref:fasciclin-2-like n=1 Tax=Epargyreus clarus TaxID=520877 RepID=UPI003C2E3B1E
MVIMNNVNIFAAFLVLFCLSKDCESCFNVNHQDSVVLLTGSSFYKECRCMEPGTGKLRWLDSHNKEISILRPGTESNVYAEWRDRNTYSLYISNISKSISGIYKCVTQYNGQEYSISYDVKAYDRPYFVHTDENQYLIDGNDSPINCDARGDSQLLFTWQKEQHFIQPDDEKYEITTNGLTIRNASNGDKGVYRCTAVDPLIGDDIYKDIKVEVMHKPNITDLVASPGQRAIAGRYLSIECRANAWPHPEYYWRKVPDMESNENITWSQVENTIIFDSLVPEDQGTYECTASNGAGNVTKQIHIDVLYAPVITYFENVTAVEGDSLAEMICTAIGRPRPNLTVSFLGSDSERSILVEKKSEGELEAELRLTFTIVERDHDGVYLCNASNEGKHNTEASPTDNCVFDNTVQATNMTVFYKPHFEQESEIVYAWNGGSLNLSCENDANPPATVNWRYQGNDIPTKEQVAINGLLTKDSVFMPIEVNRETMYGIYECIATNEYGDAKKFVTLQEAYPPPPVQNVSVLDLTATTVTFEITGPEVVMGPPVIGFTAEYDEADNYNITTIHINRTWSKNRPFKLEKLKPNTTYFIKFAAVNKVGASSWSNIFDFVTSENYRLHLNRSIPEQLYWESDGVVKWTTPDTSEPIDYYVVKYCLINDTTVKESLCKEERIDPTTEFRLNQIEPNSTYYIEILAHASLGNYSATHIYVTTPEAYESAPLISAEAVIGISVVVVFICLAILDVILFVWRRQGIIASCCYKKNKKRIEDNLQSRDKKGLLRENGESVASDTLKRPDREYEYKHTGIITGKHSAV